MKMMIFENKVDENNLFENEMDNRNSVMLSFFLQQLKTKKVVIDRFKLNKNPEIFEQHGISQKIDDGMKLPITVVDGKSCALREDIQKATKYWISFTSTEIFSTKLMSTISVNSDKICS